MNTHRVSNVLANVTALTSRHNVLNVITLCLFIKKLYNKNQGFP